MEDMVGDVRCALLPVGHREALATAVTEGGGRLVPVHEANALIWTSSEDADELRSVLDANPAIEWVQLPFAGIEPFVDVLDHEHVWTCGKGVYAEPVAEHALALALGGYGASVGTRGVTPGRRPTARTSSGPMCVWWEVAPSPGRWCGCCCPSGPT
jgi:hypothetical protein